MCILYRPRSRDAINRVSTETVRNVQRNAQIHTVHGITFCHAGFLSRRIFSLCSTTRVIRRN